PRNPIVSNLLGMIAEQEKRFGDAIAAYTKAIEALPKSEVYYVNRGNAKLSNKDYDGALADFDQAIALAPDKSGGYARRAALKAATGDIDGAAADYKGA